MAGISRWFDLTHAQKRIWNLEKIYPRTSMHNIGGTIYVKGTLNYELLGNSILHFIKFNENIRMVFFEDGHEVRAGIKDFEDTPIDYIDFSQSARPYDDYTAWEQEAAARPFDCLTDSLLYYFAVIKFSNERSGYFIKMHHLIADGWSIQVMTDQIHSQYEAWISGKDKEPSVEGYNHQSCIDREKNYLTSPRFEKDKVFWANQLSDLPGPVIEHDRSDVFRGGRKVVQLDIDRSFAIRQFINEHKLTMNAFFVCLIASYFQKISNYQDVAVCLPVYNRSGKCEKHTFGMFTSTMPYVSRVRDFLPIADQFQATQKELMRCYLHQKYPFDILFQELSMYDQSDSLFQLSINYYNTKLDNRLLGFELENKEFYPGEQFYPLHVVIKDWSDEGRIRLEYHYRQSAFSRKEIERTVEGINCLLDGILRSPNATLPQLPVMSEGEQYELLTLNTNSLSKSASNEKTVVDLFDIQAYEAPYRIAVIHNDQSLTYEQLQQESMQLTCKLIQRNIGRESVVSILFNHSIEAVIAMLAILRTGAAYLPVDPDYPLERIQYMLQNSGSKLLLTDKAPEQLDLEFEGDIVFIRDLPSGEMEIIQQPDHPLPSDIAYVIYTSGSTGKPKGVMVDHKALTNYIQWAKNTYIKHPDDRFALYSSLAFDLTVTSIYTPLINGNAIMIYNNNQLSNNFMSDIVKDNQVQILKLTPSHLGLLQDLDIIDSTIHSFIVGGEDLKCALARKIHERFGGNIRIFNEYGPTEATVGCMIYKFDPRINVTGSVPIGTPIDRVSLYVLDKHLQPVRKGSKGELYIQGSCLSRGYIHNPEMTDSRFLINPLTGKKIYKTGDYVRWIDDGVMEYIGRIDNQVKLRSYRIELGEIEGCLLQHPSIHSAVVKVYNNGGVSLVCYYVTNTEVQLTEKELSEYLALSLPKYMVPTRYIPIPSIPYTSNGKVDKDKLPSFEELQPLTQSQDREKLNVKSKALLMAAENVLGTSSLWLDANFYHHGGDSIKAIQLVSELSKLGFDLKTHDVLNNPIFQDLTVLIKETSQNWDEEYAEGEFPLSPIAKWFFNLNLQEPGYYNQSVMIRIPGELTASQIETIFEGLIAHQDSLRINVVYREGRPEQLFYNPEHLVQKAQIHLVDLTSVSLDEGDKAVAQWIAQCHFNFALDRDLLIKPVLFDMGEHGKTLYLTAHHLIVDAITWRMLIEDLNQAVDQTLKGLPADFAFKTTSYKKWVKLLYESKDKQSMKRLRSHWNETYDFSYSYPEDQPDGDYFFGNCRHLVFEMECNNELNLACKMFNMKINELLVVAISLALWKTGGQSKVKLELEGHGREWMDRDEVELSRSAGWFTVIYPIILDFDSDDTVSCVHSAKDQLRPQLKSGFMQFIDHMLGETERQFERNVRFNYLGELEEATASIFDFVQSWIDMHPLNVLPCQLDINMYKQADKLKGQITFSQNRFKDNTIIKLQDEIKYQIKSICLAASSIDEIVLSPSDFEEVAISQEELDSLFDR